MFYYEQKGNAKRSDLQGKYRFADCWGIHGLRDQEIYKIKKKEESVLIYT